MDIIALRLHTNHSVAAPRGSVMFVRGGTVAFQTRRSDVLLDANHALLVPATAEPAAITANGGPAWLTFICEPGIDFGAQPSVRLIESAVFLQHFYITLNRRDPRALASIAPIVHALLTAAPEKPSTSSAHSPSYGRLMQTFVNAALARPFSLLEVARASALSPFTASRAFHREAGLSLRIYVRRLRLRTALARIAARDDLSQVALQLGFFDHAHFTKAFRAEFGIAPSQWRDVVVAALGTAA